MNELNQPIEPNTLKFIKKYIVRALRRYWRYFPSRSTAIKRARLERGVYQCEMCKQTGFSSNQLQVDHIIPAQTLENGINTWFDLIMFIKRLYVSPEDLQTLCYVCHSVKSQQEVQMRKYYRNLKKNENKD
jgi:5-methylcytosine-specific restriction endonuclease McrA